MTQKEKYENYYGWIPCVGGELLFEHTAPALAEYDVYSINHLISSCATRESNSSYASRYIIASSVYDWQDSPDSGAKGLFRVVVVGQVGKADFFCGRTYIIPVLDKHGKKNVCMHEEELLKQLDFLDSANYKDSLRSTKHQGFEDFANARQYIREFIGDKESFSTCDRLIENIKQTKHSVTIDFKVSSEGFATLYASHLPFDGSFEQKYTACRQAFYYIKYLLHRHSHHDPANDSLTTVHRCKDNFTLGKLLIRELKKALIDFKRGDFHNKKEMTGVAVYAKSLLVSCGKNNDKLETKPSISSCYAKEQYKYFENLSSSLSLLHNEHVSFWGGWRATFSAAYQVLATFFMLLTPFLIVGVKNFAEHPDRYTASNQNLDIVDPSKASFKYVVESVINGSPITIASVYVCLIVLSISLAIAVRKPSSRYRKRENRFSRWLKNTAKSKNFPQHRTSFFKHAQPVIFGTNRCVFGIKRWSKRIAQNEKTGITKLVISTLILLGAFCMYVIFKGISTIFSAVFLGLL